MRAPATLLLLGFLFLAGPPSACASPQDPGAGSDDPALAAARDAAANARAAIAESGRAAEDARRARRAALLEAIRAEDALAGALREKGRESEAAESDARSLQLLSELGLLLRAGAARPRPPAAAGVPPAPRVDPAEGLPPLLRRADASRDAVGEALDWLARHQSPGGFWDCDGFGAACRDGKCPGPGGPLFDPGVSGLATVAFLGNGETHKTPRFGHVVRDALKYLKGVQDAEGCFGSRTSNHFTYNHALATLAMCEAYGLTQSPIFKGSAQAGVDFALKCQNPYLGWRYGVRPQDNDTSVTGWMVMALKSGKGAGLNVDDGAFQGALAWIDKVTEPEYGRVGYTARGNGPARPQELMDSFPVDRSEALTASGMLTRIHCGEDLRTSEALKKGADLLLRTLPEWDPAKGCIDFYYWYFGSLALGHVGGEQARRWNEALVGALLPCQRGVGDGCARGSWDPVDPWGADGGRAYSTAVGALCLEIGNRQGTVR